MKKVFLCVAITLIVMGSLIYVGFLNKDDIYKYYQEKVLKVKDDIVINKNEYFKDKDYFYIQNTDDFVAKDEGHLRNIFYTIINSGTNDFVFYCDNSYTSCTSDVEALLNDEVVLSNINNFVHPYNSFAKINASYDDFGKVHVKVTKVYSDEDINTINEKVDEVISKKIKSSMTNKEKIEVIHNYIINNGDYATDKIRNKYKDKSFNKASDILINGYGLCSAYSDAMALFLYKFGIDNYKIASDTHIWNLVKVKNKWLHLDLTWDDPVTSTGENRLEILFLLIDNDRLKELNVKKHDFDKKVYKEALN